MNYKPWDTILEIGLGKLDQFFLSFLHHGSILPEKSCPVRCAQRMIQCCNPKRRSSPDAPQDVLEETNVWERGSKITILLKHMNSIRIHCNRTILASCHVQLVAGGKQGRCTEHMRRPATSFALQTLHPVQWHSVHRGLKHSYWNFKVWYWKVFDGIP